MRLSARLYLPVYRGARAFCVTLLLMTAFATAQTQTDFVFGDALPDAPELAARGDYSVGVRTLEAVNPDQLDVLAVTPEAPNPRYDRPLTLEVFYPGTVPAGQEARTTYEDVYGYGPEQSRTPERIPLSFRGAGAPGRGGRRGRRAVSAGGALARVSGLEADDDVLG